MALELIDTQTTDSNGEASITYTGTGAGEIEFRAKVSTLLQETYDIVDALNVQTGDTTGWYSSPNIVLDNGRLKWTVPASSRYLGLRGLSLINTLGKTINVAVKLESEKEIVLAGYYNDGTQWLTLDSVIIDSTDLTTLELTVPSSAESVWIRLQSYSQNPLDNNDIVYVDEWYIYPTG